MFVDAYFFRNTYVANNPEFWYERSDNDSSQIKSLSLLRGQFQIIDKGILETVVVLLVDVAKCGNGVLNLSVNVVGNHKQAFAAFFQNFNLLIGQIGPLVRRHKDDVPRLIERLCRVSRHVDPSGFVFVPSRHPVLQVVDQRRKDGVGTAILQHVFDRVGISRASDVAPFAIERLSYRRVNGRDVVAEHEVVFIGDLNSVYIDRCLAVGMGVNLSVSCRFQQFQMIKDEKSALCFLHILV